ncbi:hypothetical protein GJ496_009956 [Pomphorhynchus laevis]|nr:hypothetical protein GJ496_009956 [Pomphorhynchus laevis]
MAIACLMPLGKPGSESKCCGCNGAIARCKGCSCARAKKSCVNCAGTHCTRKRLPPNLLQDQVMNEREPTSTRYAHAQPISSIRASDQGRITAATCLLADDENNDLLRPDTVINDKTVMCHLEDLHPNAKEINT